MAKHLSAALIYLGLGLSAGGLLWGALALLRSGAHQTVEYRASTLLRVAPLAPLEAPSAGIARYRGTLVGPADRTTPRGHKAVAWWSSFIKDQGSDDPDKTQCTRSQIDQLSLRSGNTVVPLAGIPARWTAARQADAGPIAGRDPLIALWFEGDLEHEVQRDKRFAIPEGRSTADASCDLPWDRYEEDFLPRDTVVEVVACHLDGALRPCPATSPLGMAVATDLEKIRKNLLSDLLIGPAVLGAASLLLSLLVLLSSRGPRLSAWTSWSRS